MSPGSAEYILYSSYLEFSSKFSIVICRRNDPISQVRQAAEIAIRHIGGPEADKALKINKVLSTEMDKLRVGDK